MRNKRLYLTIVVVVVLLLLSFIPRIGQIRSVGCDQMEKYPALLDSYRKLSTEYPSFDITTEDTIQIVTVRNLWGSWERYVLSCYLAEIPDVPGDKMVNCRGALCVLSPWNEESFFTELCRLKVIDYTQRIAPGENTVLYEDAEFTWPRLAPVRYRVHAASFSSDEAFVCDALPTALTEFSLATNNHDLVPNQSVTTTVCFAYTLKMLGRQIAVCDYELPCNHLVNT